MKYALRNIMIRDKDGSIITEEIPLKAKKALEKDMEMSFDGIVRITFENKNVHNWYKAPEQLTQCDTIAAVRKYDDGKGIMVMFVYEGDGICVVGLIGSTENKAVISHAYRARKYEKKLKPSQVKNILLYAWKSKAFDIKSVLSIEK